MVNFFAEYLRNNLSSLEESGLISFETELSHITTYLEIEKIRFEDSLEIEYDIKCDDFYLPVLTVQPIVENAVKHGTSKKRGGGKVVISTYEDAKNYIIKVSDTGCGIKAEDLPKIKTKFFKANHTRRGSGIGLAVADEIMTMHGGNLIVDSKEGVGTTVTIILPAADKNEKGK
jgi:sensor histidine kinase YesM